MNATEGNKSITLYYKCIDGISGMQEMTRKFNDDMIIKYAPQIREEIEVYIMLKDSIDDEKANRQPASCG